MRTARNETSGKAVVMVNVVSWRDKALLEVVLNLELEMVMELGKAQEHFGTFLDTKTKDYV